MKQEFSDPAVEKIDREVRDLMDKQSLGYKLIAYVGKKSFLAKRIMGCGDAIWFTPRGRQWRKADRIEAVRPSVHQSEHTWEEDSRPRNFRQSIRHLDWMEDMINENTSTNEWLRDWDIYASQDE